MKKQFIKKFSASLLVLIIIISIFPFALANVVVPKPGGEKSSSQVPSQPEIKNADSKLKQWLKGYCRGFADCVITTYKIILGGWSAVQAYERASKAGESFAEQQLTGTSHCDSCNIPYTECTPDRCGILGSCKWVSKDDNNKSGICMTSACEPTGYPLIADMKANFYTDRTRLEKSCPSTADCPLASSSNGKQINVSGELIYTISDVELNITLNQRAKCRYVIDSAGKSFSELSNEFDDNQFYPLSQSIKIDLSRLELGKEHTIYIKCDGTCGESTPQGFDWNYIRFKFEEKPDELAPVIVKVIPDPIRQRISNESSQETIEVWLDEAGSCEYSHIGTDATCGNNLTTKWQSAGTGGLNESNMCPVGINQWNIAEWKCENNKQCTSIPNEAGELTFYNKSECSRCYLKIDTTQGYEELNWTDVQEKIELGRQNETLADKIPADALNQMQSLGLNGISKVFRYMFRCRDSPAENIMNENNSYSYVIMTYPPYDINITKPENNSRTFERQPEIEVNSTRLSQCKYSVNEWASGRQPAMPEWEKMKFVSEDFSELHQGKVDTELNATTEGLRHIMYIRCRDLGGLEERNSVLFYVLKDIDTPILIRTYSSSDYLYIETNEESDCVYSNNENLKCNYNFSDGNAMIGNLQYIHSAPWSLDNIYYIKCKDKWDNYPDSRRGDSRSDANTCTAKISPFEL